MIRVAVTAVLIAINLIGVAQTYHAEVPLHPADSDGFYKVVLTPEMDPFIDPAFSNIRIHDTANKEVPYILGVDEMKKVPSQFMEYTLEDKLFFKDSCTVIILANHAQSTINNISLMIKNAAVVKEARLAGSDDKQTWYALKDVFQMGFINNPGGISEIEIVDFPNSNYPYYRLVINDTKSAPLNILRAGYYTSGTAAGVKYLQLPAPRLNQKEETTKKRSYITVAFDTLHFIDKVRWHISGLPYYLRQATLYTESERLTKHGKREKFREYIGDIQLNSRQENVEFIPTVKTNNLLLEISNDDNPPLEVSGVECFREARQLTVWLQKEKHYILKFGDNTMPAPVYDLQFFKDSISSDLGYVKTGILSKIVHASDDGEHTFFTTRAYIWVAIIAVIVFLGFMSLKMIRETNATKKEV